ncbi:right-handed parallel beta-helix repeat-containing protein [Salinibacterium sp. SYSU T00001]|uniref:right-handed parallel beta-helix repeat-containing protein n=1 Tax=Homoserinimonas sedimenticola TaxID=2986805 RepID=UPI002235FA7D|nr:right-handed parallel beta-helix repeat-containing protein [Salinibacterium sedimenticola]MCW4385454.1 right-handed parallel beta-helix repeat-containing protein [Salinibacterium sedimenticola]
MIDTQRPLLRWLTLAGLTALLAAVLVALAPRPDVGGDRQDASAPVEAPTRHLMVHEGDLIIKQAGTIVDSLDIRGFVRVEAPNVTISNSIIRGRATMEDAILLWAGSGKSAGLEVIDTEIAPTHHSPRTHGVYGYDFTLTGVDIHHVIDAVHIFGDNVTITDSRLHDHLHYINDPTRGGRPSHDDGIQIQQGRNIRITDNELSDAYNAAIQITQDRGAVSSVTISGNRLSGGGCTVNVAEKDHGPVRGLTISDNAFGTSRFDCDILLPPTTNAETAGNRSLGSDTVRVERRAQ